MYLTKVLKSVTVAAATAVTFSTAVAADITGAGATFPYPIYAKWAEAYNKATGNQVNYQSIGSGGGIKQIKAKTVDFGASDMPLDQKELEAAGLMQFPVVMGGVVPVVNVEGIAPGELKLTGEVLADIYLGNIKTWDAPEIAALNPGVKLPSQTINVVQRSDGSGTTFLFVNYLSKVSEPFNNTVGVGTAVKWPVGIGGKGNEGVSALVQRVRNSIGYVEYAYAKRTGMSHAVMKNSEGNFVQPGDASFKAAAAGADWAKVPGFAVILTNQPGKDSWPITGASFILLHKTQTNTEKGKEVMKFFDWSYKNGGAMATELEYVAMPPSVVRLVQQGWKENIKDASGNSLWQPSM